MGRLTAGIATRAGLGLTFSGILLFLAAVGATNGRLVLSLPAVVTLFVAGPLFALLGIAAGVRYGNLERVSPHFDEETGRVEGHSIGGVMNPIARDNTTEDGTPGGFVPSGPLVAAGAFVPMVAVPPLLRWATGVDTGVVVLVTVVLFVGSVVGIVQVKYAISRRSDVDG